MKLTEFVSKTQTPWPQSASELYRQSGRRPSAKLVPTFTDRGVSRGQRNGSPRPLISVFCTGAATFYSSSSSIDLTRLSGPRSRPTTTQKIWQHRESNPRPLYLQPETLTTEAVTELVSSVTQLVLLLNHRNRGPVDHVCCTLIKNAYDRAKQKGKYKIAYGRKHFLFLSRLNFSLLNEDQIYVRRKQGTEQ